MTFPRVLCESSGIVPSIIDHEEACMVQDYPTLESLSDRLRKLEQENRALKRWGVAGLLAVGAFVAIGAAQNNQTVTNKGALDRGIFWRVVR